MQTSRNNIVFFGTPQYAADALEALCTAGFSVVAVVTRPDRKVGRQQAIQKSPVKLAAERHHIAVIQPERGDTLADALRDLQPDIGVLFAYGALLPPSTLELFPRGILNLHPSLLPKYRGPSPVQQAILDGMPETGISIIRLDAQLDHGPLLAQVRTVIGPDETASQLLQRLAALGIESLIEKVLPAYVAGSLVPTVQDDQQATYTKTLQRQDGKIDWTQSAQQIYRQYRALYSWPGVFTVWKNRRLKIIRLHVAASTHAPVKPGTILRQGNVWRVATGSGDVVPDALQLEGSVPMSAESFVRGHQDFVGSVVG